jgi:CheY-like chemotaxis protein
VAKILVADDNSNIQKMVVLALKDQGIDVVAVGNGEAAVRKISDIHPDLVLADVFMPVRNGYEVCRYVKEDAKLAHIPVILLVGAFDPLDEQEAQRVAADGVLKKPFVPPDPLISMVKSALTRAGVSLGPAPAADKPTSTPTRPITELFHKSAAPPAEKLPEALPEPMEEFPMSKPPVKISQGQEPVAFGSLLDTAEEEAPAIASKPMINLAPERNWDEESHEAEEEPDEESTPGWRATTLDEALEKAAAPSTDAPSDWRDQVFKDNHLTSQWAASPEPPAMVEAAEVPSVAVSTIEGTPATSSPVGGDAWATATAAEIEEKLLGVPEASSTVPEVVPVVPEKESVAVVTPEAQSPPASEEVRAADPPNWAVVPETSWELEAKRASLLASTWDAPAAHDAEETQDISSYAGHVPELHEELAEEQHATENVSAYSGALETHDEAAPVEEPPEPAAVEPVVEETLVKPWERGLEISTAPPVSEAEEEARAESAPVESAPLEEHKPEPEPEPVPSASEAPVVQQAQPDMDELVARVLQKMNPEVISRVTQEILKPVIEAIVRDELDSKK